MRDYQQRKVYRWEDSVVASRLRDDTITFEDAQTFINGVWLSMGLMHPPLIDKMAAQATKVFACANREFVKIREQTPKWIIIHELAHSMAAEGEGHGPDFVGIYIKLLQKVLGFPVPVAMYTLKEAGIDFNLGAKPHHGIDNFS